MRKLIPIFIYSLFSIICTYMMYSFIDGAIDRDNSSIYRSVLVLIIICCVCYIVHLIVSESNDVKFEPFLLLLLFYFGLFTAIQYFKSVEPTSIVPGISPGIFALRAWDSEVEVKDINIWYMVENRFKKVPQELINDEDNWKKIWTQNKKNNCYFQFMPNDDFLLKLNRGGVVIDLRNLFNGLYPENIRFDATVKFNKVYDKEISTFQIGLNVPVIDDYLNTKDFYKTEEYYPDIYLGFELYFHDTYLSKIWIPFLDWGHTSEFKHPKYKLKKYGFDRLEEDKEYHLSAVILNNRLKFQIFAKNDGNKALTLFEAAIDNKD